MKQLEAKIENLENARVKYEAKLEAENRELALLNLRESKGQQYLDELNQFTDTIAALRAKAISVRDSIESLNEEAATFFQTPLMPTRLLESIAVNPLLESISLEDFLQGRIEETENSENASFVEQETENIKGMVCNLAVIGQDLLDQFQWWCSVLVQFSSNPTSIERKSYVPPDRRPQQAITTSTVMNIPPHARGGPDIDEKDDPHSDYWVRRRAALRPQEKSATTVLGKAKGVQSNV